MNDPSQSNQISEHDRLNAPGVKQSELAGHAPELGNATSGSMKLQAGYEPIPGYILQEPLGKGGFGEVWSALAPGGFQKAIKFVYGARDEKRADRELRSLEHMTGVNHPFLLTLERYEFVDDRLVIVSELADGSLEDVYNRHIERGSCGIPRQALLSYLNDAADALDYLHKQFQLQHLDIKPGNLLLVGGHVKVADFGLLKDLREEQCSMIGGLTPIYAPPEVFDGRPSKSSDQYSLAVMYQELLTGTRPFSGRTIAQLATQHVHTTPNLDSLPPCDRPIVARALEKEPERRYDCCRDMVEALLASQSQGVPLRASGKSASIGGDTLAGTITTSGKLRAPVVEELPGLSRFPENKNPSAVGNCLVVGIGGTGADVLLELNEKMKASGKSPDARMESVLIDTDSEKMYLLRSLEGPDSRSPCVTVHTPLLAASQYRDKGTEKLRTISRRWIYNVPRSRSTEGMRPLGRLAMVDHSEAIRNSLAAAIKRTAKDSRVPLTVYLVGSLTGGTGSGMLLDIAYLLRHLLDSDALEQSDIIPLFAANSVRPQARNPLGNADSAAALNELRHYLKPENGYSGDPGANWPSVPAARSPLRNAYVIANPDRIDGAANAVETISEYIWCCSQGAAEMLSVARKPPVPEEGTLLQSGPTTRSVGVVSLSCQDQIETAVLSAMLAKQTLAEWVGNANEARQLAPGISDRLAARCGVSVESLLQQKWQPFAEDPVQRRGELEQWLRKQNVAEGLDFQPVFERLQEKLGRLSEGSADDRVIHDRVTCLRREVTVRLQDKRMDLYTVIEVVQTLLAQVQAGSGEINAPQKPLQSDTVAGNVSGTDTVLDGLAGNVSADHYLQNLDRTEKLLEQAVSQSLLNRVHVLEELLTQFIADLKQHLEAVAEVTDQLDAMIGAEDQVHLSEAMYRQLEACRQPMHLDIVGRLLAMPLMKENSQVSEKTLLSVSLNSAKEQISMQLASKEGGKPETVPMTLEEQVQAAVAAVRPAFLDLGGKQRLLLIVGSEREAKELSAPLEAAYGGAITTTIVEGVQPTLVHEAQSIPLVEMIDRLIKSLGGNHKVAVKLQSRVDVEWPSPI
ncbi:Tubulin-like protein [Roseimaritima multifibrata]|uniref:Tubulin-like protein n=1 Tax=Roseimaritima multifibrata TaxID=1930274 RepID=A0A517MND5_9BACT|nr:tubulin-like doman-containing protein [Roseimaritima multifibrata]QDS96395.1 Tubulin-like protein [Roseimaritima multifibrata]